MKVAIIDADFIIHVVSYHHQTDVKGMLSLLGDLSPEEKTAKSLEMYQQVFGNNTEAALLAVDSFINDIIRAVNATHYHGFVGHRDGSITFRHKMETTKPYKGNRKSGAIWVKFWKPIFIEHMVTKWGFEELTEIEADDATCIYQHKYNADGIPNVLCSPDKDLKQSPGHHYDYKKVEFSNIEPIEAMRLLYKQCLVGDTTDNIPGCPGVGAKAKVLKEIDALDEQVAIHNLVFETFKTKVPENTEAFMNEQMALVYMLRTPEQVPGGYELQKPNEVRHLKSAEPEVAPQHEQVTQIIFNQ